MAVRKITSRIYSVGAVDWDRRLFDELIPLPAGTTYNSYLIKGADKNVLIDSVDPSMAGELFRNLDSLGITEIHYVVCQHAEQDHSGSINLILEKYHQAKIITNEKCRELLIEHLGLSDEDFILIKDGEEFSAGDISLRFISAPWVHWPETMLTYFKEEKALFTCDMFGSHLATDKLFSDEDDRLKLSAKRYFAEIMLPFRNHIRKHLDKISQYEIDLILPSHGPIHREPQKIIDYYRQWSSEKTGPLVIIPYVSMHDSTEGMVKYLEAELIKRDLGVIPFNLSIVDLGELAMSLIDASTVVFGSPTVLGGPHPLVAYAAMIINALRPPTKSVAFIGSYGWGGRTEEILKSLITTLKYEDLGSVFIRGILKREDKKRLSELADRIRDAIKY